MDKQVGLSSSGILLQGTKGKKEKAKGREGGSMKGKK